MKPHTLKIKNIGPFCSDTEIHFDKLGDFFLICGKTGAGKTTIFDAITYALYGKLPGARTKLDIHRLRTDFVPPTEEAYVCFTFSVRGCRWRITRRLPRQYTAAKTGKTAEKPEEVLLEKQDGSLQWNTQTAKITEANETVRTVIGLSADEFTRIILLPQGAFADFLKQSSNDRRKTLAKLFPSDLYRKITERAKEKKIEYEGKLKQITENLATLCQEHDVNETQARLAEYARMQTEAEEKQNIRNGRLSELEKEITKLTLHLQKCREANDNRKALLTLANRQDEIGQIRNMIQKAQRAADIAGYIEENQQAAARLNETKLLFADIKNKFIAAGKRQKELRSSSDAIAGKTVKKERLAFLEHDAQQFIEKDEKLNACRTAYAQAGKKLNNAEKAAVETEKRLTKMTAELAQIPEQTGDMAALYSATETLRAEHDKTAKQLEQAVQKEKLIRQLRQTESDLRQVQNKKEKARAQLESARAGLEKKRIERMAANLASALSDGSPCPVCGSVTHPAPAPDTDCGADDTDERQELVSGLENAFHLALSECGKLEDRYAQTGRDPLLLAEIPAEATLSFRLNEIKNALSDKEREQRHNMQNMTRRQALTERINVLRTKQLADQQEKQRAGTDAENLKVQIGQMEKDAAVFFAAVRSAGFEGNLTAREAARLITAAKRQLQKELEDYQKEKDAAETEYIRLETELTSLQKLHNDRTEEARQAAERLQRYLAPAGFETAEEAAAARLDSKTQEELAREADRWQKEKSRLEDILSAPGVPGPQEEQQVRERMVIIETDIQAMQLQKAEAEEAIRSLNRQIYELEHIQKKRSDLENQLARLQEEAGHHIRLADDLCGNNPASLPLESWVLGMYLEEITAHAARRLLHISEGRYTLRADTKRSGGNSYRGLDLEIYDAFTGKTRPCETLSGGETFMASISLALALTDTVQSHAGGITLDSLFIDEGFGTLDDTSLEKALSVLDEIRGSRCIGIISHVADLRSRIPERLEIIKTAAGSTVRMNGGAEYPY